MKKLFTAIMRFGPWPLRTFASSAMPDPSMTRVALGFGGLLVGLITAIVFLVASMLLPSRIALLMSLCIGLAAAMPRPAAGLQQPPLTGPSGLALALLLLIKLEAVSEIDHAWSAIILICSTTWARCAVLASRAHPISILGPAKGSARVVCLLIGASPMVFFGLLPEPAWGLWMAAFAVLIISRLLKGVGWTAPLVVRWALAETIYCVVVVLLMSAAALAEITEEDSDDS
ncbi:MAG: hypothetical protein KGP33_00375 [Betaproteobacteria bacterium]|nr:hypothetical protein [Betaproteobacteria bacterium]